MSLSLLQKEGNNYPSVKDLSQPLPAIKVLGSFNQVNERLELLLSLLAGTGFKGDDVAAVEALFNHLSGLLEVLKSCGDVPEMNKRLERLLSEVYFWKEHLLDFEQLTPREKEVLTLLAQGLANKEIADRLMISLETAKHYRKTIKSKLGIISTADLVLYSQAFNLI